jgi:uncharacterized protein with LGFP repeats
MRGRLIAALCLATLGLLAWVAAPALSVRPYMPAAVDFESTLPAAKRLAQTAELRADAKAEGEPAPRWISPPVAAQHTFDLVGVARETREIEIRVRDEGGGWSDWVPQEDATPIFVDGADEAQVRAPFKPDGELHFVNVSGTSGGLADRALNAARESINSAFIAVASTPVAEAIAPKPQITPRALWGADNPDGGCPPRGAPELGGAAAAVIHHTVNANDYTPEEAPGIVLGICRFHVYGNGWNDIGYNALVDRYGTLYEGRAGGLKKPIVGAQAQGFNSVTTSIASIGDHTTEPVTPEATRSIIHYLAWRMAAIRAFPVKTYPVTGTVQLTSAGGSQSRYPAGAVITAPRIVGHLTLGLTSCPGTIDPQIPAIRTAVQKRIKRYAKRKCTRKQKRKGRCGKKRARARGAGAQGAR